MKKKIFFLLILFTLNSNVLAENYTVIEEDTNKFELLASC